MIKFEIFTFRLAFNFLRDRISSERYSPRNRRVFASNEGDVPRFFKGEAGVFGLYPFLEEEDLPLEIGRLFDSVNVRLEFTFA